MTLIDIKRKIQIEEFLKSLNLTCHNLSRLDVALTHSSYTFENKLSPLESNERLEFLGDAVLKLIASEYLHERFPEYAEGELTKIRSILISDLTLAKLAHNIHLSDFLKLGFHEEKAGGRKRSSTLACAFEAFLGAMYLDGKLSDLQKLLISLFEEEVTDIDQNAAKHNFKAILQEYTQGKGIGLPTYEVSKEDGPSHNKTFEIKVYVDGEYYGYGVGKSKKEAQQKAAEMAVNAMGIINE